jgi:GWxTD domain-containing protein
MSLISKITVIIGTIIVVSTSVIKAQGVDAYFYYAPFYTQDKGTYIETYIAIAGNSVNYIMNSDSALQAEVEVTMLFKNVDQVKEYRKFKIVSPSVSGNATYFPSFIDLQRIAIPQGVYNFELIIKDINAPDNNEEFKISQLITVNIPENQLALSGIELIERYYSSNKKNIFYKNGYECIPYVSDFFPHQIKYLRFYAELYNAAKELGPLEDFLLLFHIENYNTSKPIKDYSSFQKEKAMNTNVIFREVNINNLPTGNYYLVIEVRDRKNNILLTTKKFFQRLNDVAKPKEFDITDIEVSNTFAKEYKSRDTLAVYLSALRPICDAAENRFIDNQLKAADIKLMQQFFYNFWVKRNETNPEYAWLEYKDKLNIVEKRYSTPQNHGFATDRGRVYLQYGPPNSIIIEKNEPSAYPYEIWHYYKIADQTDKKFLFYNKNSLYNDYTLLYTNMIGELQNPEWEKELYSRNGEWRSDSFENKKSKAREYMEGN